MWCSDVLMAVAWRVWLSCGRWYCVVLLDFAEVSHENTASILRSNEKQSKKSSSSIGCECICYFQTLDIEAVRSPETSEISPKLYVHSHIPEEGAKSPPTKVPSFQTILQSLGSSFRLTSTSVLHTDSLVVDVAGKGHISVTQLPVVWND